MEELFNKLLNLSNVGSSEMLGNTLSTDIIIDSVARVSDFFNIESQANIELGDTPALGSEVADINSDGFHFYNLAQLDGMGIKAQDGLDIFLTYEITHNVLHCLQTGFDSNQEELCCHYMTGVCAGLNKIDISKLENAIIYDSQSHDNIVGSLRVEAIERGLRFANDYLSNHNLLPTFNDSIEDFKCEYLQDSDHISKLRNDLYAEECVMEHYRRLLEREPDNELAKHHYNLSIVSYNKVLDDYDNQLNPNKMNAVNTESVDKEGTMKENDYPSDDNHYNVSFVGKSELSKKYDEAKSLVNAKQEEVHNKQMQYNFHPDKTTARRLSVAKEELKRAEEQLKVAKEKLNHAKVAKEK